MQFVPAIYKHITIVLFLMIFSTAACLAQSMESDNELAAWVKQNAMSPAAYLVDRFQDFDIIFLAEDHAVKNNLEFVASLIPALYGAGVYNLGMEFGAVEVQARLDSLITAESYNEQVAREIMYRYNVGWAYKEYTDIYRSAWKHNKALPEGARPFRILNISYEYNWTELKGVQSPENMSRVFHKGTPDAFRAKLIEREVIAKGDKGLFLVGSVHGFTRYRMPSFNVIKDNFVEYEDRYLANRLYQKYPDKVFSVLLHFPFSNLPNHSPSLVTAANGRLEEIMALNQNLPAGFDLINSPMGKLHDDSYYSMGYPGFTLDQFFEGYIFLAPIHELEGCSLDENWFMGYTWEEVKPNIPDPYWKPELLDLDDYIQLISNYTNLKQRYAPLLH